MIWRNPPNWVLKLAFAADQFAIVFVVSSIVIGVGQLLWQNW